MNTYTILIILVSIVVATIMGFITMKKKFLKLFKELSHLMNQVKNDSENLKDQFLKNINPLIGQEFKISKHDFLEKFYSNQPWLELKFEDDELSGKLTELKFFDDGSISVFFYINKEESYKLKYDPKSETGVIVRQNKNSFYFPTWSNRNSNTEDITLDNDFSVSTVLMQKNVFFIGGKQKTIIKISRNILSEKIISELTEHSFYVTTDDGNYLVTSGTNEAKQYINKGD